ncbi:hypothetical protein N656DRAFT_231111 [Canariomyces notabilis]|uniref:Uncharacterized protein n=1 Tax=Canariomyces notabilis TaxID=2074819 RepID=A0AAN6TKK3_9PEZI|nr:hypothetical protein N656DRAFT_231111 [Canariomyces arenarius]
MLYFLVVGSGLRVQVPDAPRTTMNTGKQCSGSCHFTVSNSSIRQSTATTINICTRHCLPNKVPGSCHSHHDFYLTTSSVQFCRSFSSRYESHQLQKRLPDGATDSALQLIRRVVPKLTRCHLIIAPGNTLQLTAHLRSASEVWVGIIRRLPPNKVDVHEQAKWLESVGNRVNCSQAPVALLLRGKHTVGPGVVPAIFTTGIGSPAFLAPVLTDQPPSRSSCNSRLLPECWTRETKRGALCTVAVCGRLMGRATHE